VSDLGFNDEQEKRARERQLLLLGALLGCRAPDLRARLNGMEFGDKRISDAAADLINPEPTRLSLRCVLNDVGLSEWNESDGSPLELLIEHVRLDARLMTVYRSVAYAIEKTNAVRAMSAREKNAALEQTEKVVDEAHRLFQQAKEVSRPCRPPEERNGSASHPSPLPPPEASRG
jgi:hypothetical protein